MDRREAKDILNGYRLLLHEETDLRHAFDLAIEALGVAENATTTATQKQVAGKLKNPDDSLLTEDSEACKEQKSKLESEDCISRQQAIEALTEWETEPLDEDIVRTLNNLPPVTPTDKDKRIKELEDLFADMLESAQSVPMFTPTVSEDCISRAEALDEFKKDYDDVFDLMTAIEELPSVTPTERTGKWIPVTKVYRTTEADFPETHIEWETATEPDEIDAVRCSECGEVFDFEDARNWCTECGAKMGGDTK